MTLLTETVIHTDKHSLWKKTSVSIKGTAILLSTVCTCRAEYSSLHSGGSGGGGGILPQPDFLTYSAIFSYTIQYCTLENDP